MAIFQIRKERGLSWNDLIISILTIAASVSDPWFIPAFYLPISAGVLYKTFISKEINPIPLIINLVTGTILFSHVIEHQLNISETSFKLGIYEQWGSNLYWLLFGIGGMINILFKNNNIYYLLSSSFFMVVIIFSIVTSKLRSEIKIVFILSMLGISSSFIIGSTAGAEKHARFFVNIIYIGITILFIRAIERRNIALTLTIILLSLSQLYSHTKPERKLLPWSSMDTLNYLRENNLNYGFGPYWGSQALAVSWISGFKTILRPVIFDKTNGYVILGGRAQTFDYWYNDLPKRKTFIIIMSDVEECHEINTCINGVTEQFGSPDRKINFSNGYIYIYNNGIVENKK